MGVAGAARRAPSIPRVRRHFGSLRARSFNLSYFFAGGRLRPAGRFFAGGEVIGKVLIGHGLLQAKAFDLISWCTFHAVAFSHGFSHHFPAAAGGHSALHSSAEASATLPGGGVCGMGKEDGLTAPAQADIASGLGGSHPADAIFTAAQAGGPNSTTAQGGGAAAYRSSQSLSSGKANDNHTGSVVCGELGALGARASAHGRPAAAHGGSDATATAACTAAAVAPCRRRRSHWRAARSAGRRTRLDRRTPPLVPSEVRLPRSLAQDESG